MKHETLHFVIIVFDLTCLVFLYSYIFVEHNNSRGTILLRHLFPKEHCNTRTSQVNCNDLISSYKRTTYVIVPDFLISGGLHINLITHESFWCATTWQSVLHKHEIGVICHAEKIVKTRHLCHLSLSHDLSL